MTLLLTSTALQILLLIAYSTRMTLRKKSVTLKEKNAANT